MQSEEYNFYNQIKNWDFSQINYTKETLTNWDMYEILNQKADESSIVLDLGTGGGEKVLKYFPKVKQIIATDFSEEMIKTANENLKRLITTIFYFDKWIIYRWILQKTISISSLHVILVSILSKFIKH